VALDVAFSWSSWDRDEPVAAPVEDHVGVAPARSGVNGSSCPATTRFRRPVEKSETMTRSSSTRYAAPPYSWTPRADVEALRREAGDGAVGVAPDEDLAALRRAGLEPPADAVAA
jgi:hypothetical protein